MKKILVAVLTLIIVVSLSACLNDPFMPEATPTPAPPAITNTPPPTNTPSPTPTISPTPTQEPTPTASPTPTAEPTPTPLAPTDVLTSGTNIYASGGGQGTLNFDLNGDGTDDVITYTFMSYTGPIPAGSIDISTSTVDMMDYDIYQCNLEVNGQPIIIQGEYMAGMILIGDIDTNDTQYEIMIPEFGPSGDPQTTFVSYNSVTPQNIGRLYENPFYNLKVDGSGEITGKKRGSKLHTWFYDARYHLDGGLIKEMKEDGLVLMGTEVTAKAVLALQMSPTDATPAYSLSVGEHATITWTDDEKWFCVENSVGLEGWFEITGFYMIGGTSATDIFDGLLMAD